MDKQEQAAQAEQAAEPDLTLHFDECEIWQPKCRRLLTIDQLKIVQEFATQGVTLEMKMSEDDHRVSIIEVTSEDALRTKEVVAGLDAMQEKCQQIDKKGEEEANPS